MIKTEISIVPRQNPENKYEIELIFRCDRFNVYFYTTDAMTKREADVRVIQIAAEFGFDTDGIIVKGSGIDTE